MTMQGFCDCFTQGIIFMYKTCIKVKVSTEFIKPHAFGPQFVNSVEIILRYMYITTLYHETHAECSIQANLCV